LVWLQLNGPTALSDEAANAMALQKGNLSLNGLPTISLDVAKALARHKGHYVALMRLGIHPISDEVAKVLMEHSGRQWLHDLPPYRT